ncbi:MAG: hypothetical protein ACLGXA_24540 [Acidobacteriota bacterium]
MAESKPKQHTLEDRSRRWHVVREARVPSTYRVKPCKSYPDGIVRVQPYIVKAVLLDFGQWPLDNRIHAGLGRVAHSTQIPLREVQKAVKVLIQHGWMSREKQARMGATKVTKLHWDKIEAASQPYRETIESKDSAGDHQKATPQDDPATYAEVAKTLMALKHVGERIERHDADWLAKVLVEEFGEASALSHIKEIPEKTLAIASNPDTNSPAKYLLKCIRRQYQEWVDTKFWPKVKAFVDGGKPGVFFTGEWAAGMLDRLRDHCIRLGENSYTIGEFSHDQAEWIEVDEDETFHCWLPITPAATNSEFQNSRSIN